MSIVAAIQERRCTRPLGAVAKYLDLMGLSHNSAHRQSALGKFDLDQVDAYIQY